MLKPFLNVFYVNQLFHKIYFNLKSEKIVKITAFFLKGTYKNLSCGHIIDRL